jgi:hypothetical protein
MDQNDNQLSYNQLYYRKNRDRILEKAKQKRLLEKQEPDVFKNRRRVYRSNYYKKNKEIIKKRAAIHSRKCKKRLDEIKIKLARANKKYFKILEYYTKVKDDLANIITVKNKLEKERKDIYNTKKRYRNNYYKKNKDKINENIRATRKLKDKKILKDVSSCNNPPIPNMVIEIY